MVGWPVLLKIVYLLGSPATRLAVLVFRKDLAKHAELLVLPHENAVLRRHAGRIRYAGLTGCGSPRWNDSSPAGAGPKSSPLRPRRCWPGTEAVALRASSCILPSRGWGQLTLTASLPRSARAWTGNGTPREPRILKHRPKGASRTIPPQLARLLRHHLHAYGCAADGRLFRGARGGPLSESLYGRIWHQARAAAMPGTGQVPSRCAAPATFAMPRCRCGWPPAPRPPKSLPAPGTACVSCSPPTPTAYPAATRSPASTSSKPSTPANGPPLAHKKRRRRQESRPSCVRATAGLNGTQLDLKPPPRSGYTPATCGNIDREVSSMDRCPGRAIPGIRSPMSR